MCPVCGGEEEIISSIRRCSEEIDELFDCVFYVRKRRLISMSHYQILPKKNKAHC